MLKKITSIFVLVIMLGSNGLAFVQIDDCGMPCCQVEVTCCTVEIAQDCAGSMAACETAILVPIVVAPINIHEQQVEDQITALYSGKITPPTEQISSESVIQLNNRPESTSCVGI